MKQRKRAIIQILVINHILPIYSWSISLSNSVQIGTVKTYCDKKLARREAQRWCKLLGLSVVRGECVYLWNPKTMRKE